MRADNTAHLKAAAAARSNTTRQRAVQTLADLEAADTPITVAGLARAAGVARSWIYSQPDLIERITRTVSPAAILQPAPASDESWQRRLELAHQRIKELTDENKQLRTQLALAHGQRRANQLTSTTPSTTQTR